MAVRAIKITGSGNTNNLFFVTWANSKYYTSPETLALSDGASVSVYSNNSITWNGNQVSSGGYYDFAISCDLTINLSSTGITIEEGVKQQDAPSSSEYANLEYIQSNDSQYINTGFKPNQDTRVVMDFQLIGEYSSFRTMFGTRSEVSKTAADMFAFNNDSTTTFRTDFYSTNKSFPVSSLFIRRTVDKNKNVTTFNGTSVTNTTASKTSSYDLYLFCMNNVGKTDYFSSMKLYSCQVYDNGILVRDFVPKLRVSDGAVGLYDLTNGVFYTNAGSGTFSYGLPPIGNNCVLINGTEYHITGGTPISEFGVGTSVYLNINGVPKEFLIVHKGNPNSSLYDASCDGVWLRMKDIYTLGQWSSSSYTNYNASSINSYLNGTFLGLFDDEVQTLIKQVKIPYVSSWPIISSVAHTYNRIVSSGSSGLSVKIFSPSLEELGFSQTSLSSLYQYKPEGSCLDYYKELQSATDYSNNSNPPNCTLRMAYYNGQAHSYFSRTMYNSDNISPITDKGWRGIGTCLSSNTGILPMLILPYDVLIDGNGAFTTGTMGRCLINGTGYDISKGKTMINGTIYDI